MVTRGRETQDMGNTGLTDTLWSKEETDAATTDKTEQVIFGMKQSQLINFVIL